MESAKTMISSVSFGFLERKIGMPLTSSTCQGYCKDPEAIHRKKILEDLAKYDMHENVHWHDC